MMKEYQGLIGKLVIAAAIVVAGAVIAGAVTEVAGAIGSQIASAIVLLR